MKDFNIKDFIYLRYVEDDEEFGCKKGDIVRYQKDWLLDELKGRRFNTCFENNNLIWTENPNADENDVMFNKVYDSIIVSEDMRGAVYLWEDDYLFLDDWLLSHLDSSGIDLIMNLQKKELPSENSKNKLVQLKEGCPDVNARMFMHFKKGERLDFSVPSVAAIFYNPSWLKTFVKTEVIIGEEKEKLFKEDFSNAIKAVKIEDIIYSHQTEEEQHFFKIKENIKTKSEKEIAELLGYYYLPVGSRVAKDDNGYITHIIISTSSFNSSNRRLEQDLLKIAERTSNIETLKVYKKECEKYALKRKLEDENLRKKFLEDERKLDEAYQEQKNNPKLFPGVNGDFIHVTKTDDIKEKYSLNQIKEFYKRLLTLNPEILKYIYFYGGTIPYILINEKESRDFGDVDMFVPTEYMEMLRQEFSRQESFEMISDSKPYAEQCMLTSRIPKGINSLLSQPDLLESQYTSVFEGLVSFMTPREFKKDYIDENGIVHNPLTEYKEEQLPYIRKIQDFGFKAKLFGVNISVFPIYEYENNIMAKSFNINDKDNNFLLGVKVLNNTKLSEFIKQVKIEDVDFKILPLEYTLASKQSAVEGNYAYRFEKDKVDIEYILSHKDELGISNEKLQEILNNYPDYSISIAYRVNGNGTTTTIGGETYKELVLKKRNLS